MTNSIRRDVATSLQSSGEVRKSPGTLEDGGGKAMPGHITWLEMERWEGMAR
jgi:hypothetical protein